MTKNYHTKKEEEEEEARITTHKKADKWLLFWRQMEQS